MVANSTQLRIGVMTPTCGRPDFARFLVAQMGLQDTSPTVLCIHQNGPGESYEWAVRDYTILSRHSFTIDWIYTPKKINRDEWYIVPLEALIYKHDCEVIFWCDHDDFYRANHISNGLKILTASDSDTDFVVNSKADLLLMRESGYEYFSDTTFTAHAPGGMSSSMCFTARFGEELVKDLKRNNFQRITRQEHYSHSDQVLRDITMPKFNCIVSSGAPTTVYHCHAATVSTRHWLSGRPPSLRSIIGE